MWAIGADVTLTDQANVLPLTRRNVTATVSRCLGRGAERIRVLDYQWGTDIASLGPPFDLILASDLAYDHRAVQPLIWTLHQLLVGDMSQVLLAYRCSDVLTAYTLAAERKFFAQLDEHFDVAEVALPLESTTREISHVAHYLLRQRKDARALEV